jgi:hypothetical protein
MLDKDSKDALFLLAGAGTFALALHCLAPGLPAAVGGSLCVGVYLLMWAALAQGGSE